jgi:hypothetical protein
LPKSLSLLSIAKPPDLVLGPFHVSDGSIKVDGCDSASKSVVSLKVSIC